MAGLPRTALDVALIGILFPRMLFAQAEPAPSDENWSAQGQAAWDQVGRCVTGAGDLNGDGRDDLVVGAPGQNSQSGVGRIDVYFGKTSGPGAAPDLVIPNPYATGSFGGVIAAAGDVNGDGFDDLLVGMPEFNMNGKVVLLAGSAAGPVPSWSLDGVNFVGQLGISVAGVGDVDGDGYDDFAVGESGYSVGSYTYEGRVLVFRGGETWPGADPEWTLVGQTAGEQAGYAVARAGDVNGDGYGDILVSGPGFKVANQIVGRVLLYAGGSSGLASTPSWNRAGTQAGTGHVALACAGNVNKDVNPVTGLECDDVIVGVSQYDSGSAGANAGQALVFLGGPGGLAPTPSWDVKGDQTEAWFGLSVDGVGDFNGDGYDDVIVGAPMYDAGTTNNGRAVVFHGGSGGLSSAPGWIANGDFTNGKFGAVVEGVGDLNGDGHPDVAGGAPDLAWNGVVSVGRVCLFHGVGPGLDALEQKLLDGLTPIPPEGLVLQRNVHLSTLVENPSGGMLVLEVELRESETEFSGTTTHVSAPVPSGGTAFVHVMGLVRDRGYRWQARARGAYSGVTSSWSAFGSATADDFFVRANAWPVVGGPRQVDAASGREIPAGGGAPGRSIRFEIPFADADGDGATLEIELRPIGLAFTGIPTITSHHPAGAATAGIDLAQGSYHWSYRLWDDAGEGSPWASFGGNAESSADFIVLPAGSTGNLNGCSFSASRRVLNGMWIWIALLLLSRTGRRTP